MELEVGVVECGDLVLIYCCVVLGDEFGFYQGVCFFCVVVVIESLVDEDWQWDVSYWLFEFGCFYMLVWGEDCGLWDDLVDWVDFVCFDFNVFDDYSVMMIWYENQSFEDVFWFVCNFVCMVNELFEIVEILIFYILEKD